MMTERVWSPQSDVILAAYMAKHNIMVQACPGAGKTSNIERLWAATDEQCIYLVFARANREEAERKLPPKQGSAVLTLNSLGHRAILRQHDVVLDGDKVKKLVREHYPMRHLQFKERNARQWQLIKCATMAKQYFTTYNITQYDFDTMLGVYDLEEYEGIYRDTREVLTLSDAMRHTIDFADQIRFPALYDEYTLPAYPSVLGDEVQDWSPIQVMLVARILCDHITLVGDNHQSIYGFRGAMCNSMEVLRTQFNCEVLPLSISYRCSHASVRLASNVYPDAIDAWEQALPGSVLHTAYNKVQELPWSGDVLVVCRCTAPLVELAYTLLEQGIACYVRGRAIGDNLINVIKRLESRNVAQLIQDLNTWHEVEVAKATSREDDKKLQALQDKVDSLHIFISKCDLHDPVDNVMDCIDLMFSQGKGVCLSTVHRAKGLEADGVYILYPGLFSYFQQKMRQLWEVEQECNIEYVALTRSRDKVVYIHPDTGGGAEREHED